MIEKKCSKCNYLLTASETFCSECGTKFIAPYKDDDKIDNSTYEKSIKSQANTQGEYMSNTKNLNVDHQHSNSLWSLLFGSSAYSISRAKWYYTKAEKIINSVNQAFFWGFIIALFFIILSMFFGPVLLGIWLLITWLGSALLFITIIIFQKLLLLGIGSIIKSTELLDKNSPLH